MKHGKITMLAGLIAGLLITGCTTVNDSGGTQPSNALKAGALGTAAGAGLGVVAANNIKGLSKAEGAIAGATIFGLAGALHGKQQDNLAAQKRELDAKIEGANLQATTVVINVTNSNGSVTPVMLRRNGGQYIGPRGEVYNNQPTEEQLRKVYGI